MWNIGLLTRCSLVCLVVQWTGLASRQMTMNKKSDDLLRGAAFHEAGHVAVAVNLGLAVGEIEISDDGSGRSQIAPADHLPLIDQIALCVAGIEAQELFNCRTHVLAAAADYRMVIGLLDKLSEAESLEHRDAACRRALEILRKHKPEVERLADHLIKHRRAHAFGQG